MLIYAVARINTETLKVAEIKATGQPHGTFGVEPKTLHDTVHLIRDTEDDM